MCMRFFDKSKAKFLINSNLSLLKPCSLQNNIKTVVDILIIIACFIPSFSLKAIIIFLEQFITQNKLISRNDSLGLKIDLT